MQGSEKNCPLPTAYGKRQESSAGSTNQLPSLAAAWRHACTFSPTECPECRRPRLALALSDRGAAIRKYVLLLTYLRRSGLRSTMPKLDTVPSHGSVSSARPAQASLNTSTEAPLPPYSSPSSVHLDSNQRPNDTAVVVASRHLGLPRLDYRLYSPPLFKLSSDLTTISSKAEYLSKNVTALVSLLRSLTTVPPKPQIHIKGSRGRRVDFDAKINLMNLLVPDDENARMDYVRCVGEGELAYRGGGKRDVAPHSSDAGLETWCRRYVEDSASIKSFTMDRVVANFDASWIEGQIRSLIASTGYRGAVDVKFVTTHSRVHIQSPDKVNQFFTTVTSLFASKNKYEVVKSVWPFATSANGEPGRRCIVRSEEVWWREWRDPIQHAICEKRVGWVTVEDKLENLMEGKGAGDEIMDWGPDVDY